MRVAAQNGCMRPMAARRRLPHTRSHQPLPRRNPKCRSSSSSGRFPEPGNSPPPSCTPSPAKSNQVLADMGGRAQWQQSYVTDDKIYCVYIADDEEAVREHAEGGGFPADSVSAVSAVIDPTTGE